MSKSQHNQVLDALLDGDSITPMDALDKYGCFRLAAVIYDIKKDGYKVKTTIVRNKLSGKRYAKYSLDNNDNLKKKYIDEGIYSM